MTRTVRAGRSTAVVAALALMLSLLMSAVTADAQPTDDPLPTIAFLARSDNPVDALAASAVAGQLGGFVALTAPTVLVEPARESLLAAEPDLVVIAGGMAAISAEVELEVRNLLPSAVVRRAAGADRNATAAEIAAFLRETGAGQPLITGGSVAGDADLRGLLSVDDLIVRNGIDATAIDGDIDAATLGGQPPEAFEPVVETVEHQAVCAGTAFLPADSDTGRDDYERVSASAIRLVSTGEHVFRCQIQLPDGARIRRVVFRVQDSTATGAIKEVSLRTFGHSGGTGTVTARTDVTTIAGTPGNLLNQEIPVALINQAFVDHTASTAYTFQVIMERTGTTGGDLGLTSVAAVYELDRLALPE